ncbi:MAG: SDR family NAD(P)-dependent oxidoreductase [Betaproteobacteria bacterium]|nr:SDR family NAD(P)-dependent oxidoreductase [Betaproteobacteria bacterium]
MQVMVTGGTGFVGSHTVAALLAAGHTVRLLVRAKTKLDAALRPLGVDPARVDAVEGDVTEEASVERALEGCDAVLHAANVFAFRGRREQVRALERVNVAGTRIVLGAAVRRRLDPVVHLSSIAALYGGVDRGRTFDERTPLGDPYGPYMRSKRDAEAVAREFQADGHAVVVVQPGGVWGPHDPYAGESAQAALQIARGQVPITMTGGFGIVDVRDVAAVCAAAMKPGRGPRIYPAFGEYIRYCDLHRTVSDAAGLRRLNLPLPPDAVMLTSFPFMWLLETLGLPYLPTEGLYMCWRDHPVDCRYTTRELGVRFRPARDAARDTVRWLIESGRLRAPGIRGQTASD